MSAITKWRGVLTIALWQIVASLCYYSVFPATDAFKADFGLSGVQVGFIVTTLTLGYTVFLFPAGALVDAYGDRPAMVGGLVGLALGASGVYFATSYPMLLVAVFVLGAAYSTAMPATNIAVAERAPRGSYNLAVGIKQVGVTLGSALAAFVVAGLALFALGWQFGFLIAAAVSAVIAVGFLTAYKGAPGSGEISFPDVRALWGNRALMMLAAGGFFVGAGVFTTTGYVVPYLESSTTATTAVASMVLGVTQLTGSAGRIGAGALADRIRGSAATASIRVLSWQSGLGAVTIAVIPLFGMPSAAVGFAILGVGLLGVTGLYHGALVALASADQSGAATAAGQTTVNFGGLVVPPVFGYLADTAGYAAGWYLLAACGALGVVCALIAGRLAD
ncbi:MFS transporter [Halarchaeum salinum]|uniref:Major facilitator superfamily (MFS) profile domain-containing protein n=1 Tax=Halarchaeum salinum TaxID=489912 RepID=A0AAV3S554_9EURY